MKEITLNRTTSAKHGMKQFSILQKTVEKDCATRVYKSFRYHLSPLETAEKISAVHEVFITKNFNTKRGIERFTFIVVGAFYLNQNRRLIKVNFQHTLKIQIKWKLRSFSPKKSAILT